MGVKLTRIAIGTGIANLASFQFAQLFTHAGNLYAGTVASGAATSGYLFRYSAGAWVTVAPLTSIATVTGTIWFCSSGGNLYCNPYGAGTTDVYQFDFGTGIWSALGIQAAGFGVQGNTLLCDHLGELHVLRYSTALHVAQILKYSGGAWVQVLANTASASGWLGMLSVGGVLYVLDNQQNLYRIAGGVATLVAATPITSFVGGAGDNVGLVRGFAQAVVSFDNVSICMPFMTGGATDPAFYRWPGVGGFSALSTSVGVGSPVNLSFLGGAYYFIRNNGSIYRIDPTTFTLVGVTAGSPVLVRAKQVGAAPYIIANSSADLYTLGATPQGLMMPAFVPGI